MDIAQVLRYVPLFEGLSDEHLALLARVATDQIVRANTLICRQGERTRAFYIIQSGQVILQRIGENGFQQAADTLGDGSHYGAASLFLGEPHDATLRASTEVRLITLRQEDLQDLLVAHPSMWHELALPEYVRRGLRTPYFTWLEPGENVVLFTRRHPFTVARPLLGVSLAFAAYLLAITLTGALIASPHQTYLLLVPGAVYLLAVLWFWVDWRNDHLVVTNQRVAHQEKVALLFESRDEAPLDRIQSIQVQRRFAGKLLGYGDLEIETAADIGRIQFHSTPNPEATRDAIFEEATRALATRRAIEYHSIQRELSKRLEREEVHGAQAAEGEHASNAAVSNLPTDAETVVWRKHWWFLLREAGLPLALCLVLGLLTIKGFTGSEPPIRALPWLTWYPYVTLCLLIPAVAWLWWVATDWANDLYIITSDRIVDIERKPLSAHESRREASLGVIQNVSLRVPHILASLLNFGDVTIQTAGRGDLTFERVSAPRRVQAEVFRRIATYREAQRQKDLAHQRAEVAEWFEAYEELQRHKPSPSSQPEPPSPPATPES